METSMCKVICAILCCRGHSPVGEGRLVVDFGRMTLIYRALFSGHPYNRECYSL